MQASPAISFARDPIWDSARWLPTTRDDLDARGWDGVDVILISGDAYVDHPAFGTAVVGRLIEREGLRVAIVPQPNWRDDLPDFKKLGPAGKGSGLKYFSHSRFPEPNGKRIGLAGARQRSSTAAGIARTRA